MRSFQQTLAENNVDLAPKSISTLQLNITKLCNQACKHCHVDSSPKRREMASDEVLDRCIELLEQNKEMTILDITGGAPELHPKFKDFVLRARKLDKTVMVRHNLTVTMEPHPITKESMEYLPKFFADAGVEIVSSLPFYSAYLTNRQRGNKVFERSIESLKRLNQVGFGMPDSNKIIHLVYNPVGTYLPPEQVSLEKEYKTQLARNFDIHFNNLFTITNMPIHRFKKDLERSGQYEEYLEKLHEAFNPGAAEGVMCRSMLSVSYDGRVYDCDFNQMLEMQCQVNGTPIDLFNFQKESFMNRKIILGNHCFGCTAGAGSSCGGATA